jgi:hypothetical protein
MSLDADQLTRLSGRADVLDADGHRLGRLQHVYDSDRTGEPIWVTVDDDRSGGPVRFVPLRGAGSTVATCVSRTPAGSSTAPRT